ACLFYLLRRRWYRVPRRPLRYKSGTVFSCRQGSSRRGCSRSFFPGRGSSAYRLFYCRSLQQVSSDPAWIPQGCWQRFHLSDSLSQPLFYIFSEMVQMPVQQHSAHPGYLHSMRTRVLYNLFSLFLQSQTLLNVVVSIISVT